MTPRRQIPRVDPLYRPLYIRINENRLPRHCKLALIEESLACLAKDPENVRLLKFLGKYTKSSPFERRAYWGVIGGVAFFSFCSLFLGPLLICALFPLGGVGAVTAMLPLIIFMTGMQFIIFNGESSFSPLLSLVRWVEKLIKGSNQEVSADIKTLEKDLMVLINKCKTKGSVEEAACQLKGGMEVFQVKEKPVAINQSAAPLYPWAALFALKNSGVASNALASPQEPQALRL